MDAILHAGDVCVPSVLVVFGHSHIPWDGTHDGPRQLNPGSPTDKRRQPRPTMAVLDVADGVLRSARILPVD